MNPEIAFICLALGVFGVLGLVCLMGWSSTFTPARESTPPPRAFPSRTSLPNPPTPPLGDGPPITDADYRTQLPKDP